MTTLSSPVAKPAHSLLVGDLCANQEFVMAVASSPVGRKATLTLRHSVSGRQRQVNVNRCEKIVVIGIM